MILSVHMNPPPNLSFNPYPHYNHTHTPNNRTYPKPQHTHSTHNTDPLPHSSPRPFTPLIQHTTGRRLALRRHRRRLRQIRRRDVRGLGRQGQALVHDQRALDDRHRRVCMRVCLPVLVVYMCVGVGVGGWGGSWGGEERRLDGGSSFFGGRACMYAHPTNQP
jgi:hypothetical protein